MTTTVDTTASLGQRLFARWYPPFMERAERAGQAEIRRAQLATAGGRTLEIGAGNGFSLPYYSDRVDELVLLEPNGPRLVARDHPNIGRSGSPAHADRRRKDATSSLIASPRPYGGDRMLWVPSVGPVNVPIGKETMQKKSLVALARPQPEIALPATSGGVPTCY